MELALYAFYVFFAYQEYPNQKLLNGGDKEMKLPDAGATGQGSDCVKPLFINGRCAKHLVIAARGFHHETFCPLFLGFFREFCLQIVQRAGA